MAKSYSYPTFVNPGMKVWAPLKEVDSPMGYIQIIPIACEVVQAAGDHARVVNKEQNYDKWLSIYDLRVEDS